MNVIGIDPGIDGAFAVLDGDRVEAVEVLPTIETLQGKDMVDPAALLRRLLEYAPYAMLCIEQVGSRPGDSHVSAFSFGRVLGRIETLLLINGWPWCSPTPQTWKRVVLTGSGVPLASDRKGQKAQAIAFAKSRFPAADLRRSAKGKVDHDGKAEALCLALYAQLYLKGLVNNPNLQGKKK